MAANKFATMLHRNTNKIVVILVYAVLEWVLIVLLLLNSLFGYLITKFAKWVGLQPPCPWCSRVDHLLEPGNSTNIHRDLVCENHATEISNLSYCSNHQKLAETRTMCEDCLASRPNHQENFIGMTHRIAILSWVSHGSIENGNEDMKRCSCCNESLSSQLYPPYLLLKPSWGDGNYTSKGTLIVEAIDDHEKDEGDKDHEIERNDGEDHEDEGLVYEHHILSDIESFILREVAEDHSSSSVSNLHSDEKDAEKDDKEDALNIRDLDPSAKNILVRQFSDDSIMEASLWEDRSLEFINLHFEKFSTCDVHRLIPIELIDFSTAAIFESCNLEEDQEEKDQKVESFASEPPFQAQAIVSGGAALLAMDEHAEKTSITSLENSAVLEVEELKQDSVIEVHPPSITIEGDQTLSNDDNNVEKVMEEQDATPADPPPPQEPDCLCEFTQDDQSSTSDDDAEVQNAFDVFMAQNNLCKSEKLRDDGGNVEAAVAEPDYTQADLAQSQETACSCQCTDEDQSSTSDNDTEADNAFDEFIAQNNLCSVKIGADNDDAAEVNEKTNLVEKNHEETIHQSSKCSEANELEEDKLPETPSSADGLHYLHKKLMLLEKRELGAEESVDGSVASEADSSDPALTIERLKTALKVERKALSALYQELEEERSASAIAANQTMAMITRLQEEKAAMQMEALQYQRMMEEQSEYDQEALQLLNELMVKREKEKQELEKELEEYRQKIMDYEAKEKLLALRRMKDGSVRSKGSSSSCSNMGDAEDELSIDLNREAMDEDNGCLEHQESSHNNPADDTVSNLEEMALDCVKHISDLDNSLAEFEEEKMSILDQLKALEEKLLTLGENEQLLDDIRMIEQSSEENNFSSPDENGFSIGFSDDKDKHSPRKTMGSLARRLLPYLDEAENETDQEAYTYESQFEPESVDMRSSVPTIEINDKRVPIEEEVDHVYERLQALEADSEFLNHCMSSIQNGDKGMDLLQEILQHLRDLKAVELRLKNLGDDDPLL